ncbi:hypothetical protein COY33_00560 [candidate division WWE3 bacterium CG_4_10_14_0_2_um_filter_42_7]|uniref:Carboxypeptidase regulatory-like domain-containing protein n=2 Tax=Katanobacteria TaxID=422282 RepID=A0A2H0XAL8_UNCKA|nr:MAG: hypothetical protein COT51_00370 [candidate division WWE3 bacterium CG08_land_8_20_14_0_20_41_15]PIZ43936.1 MAG: hypothetical protein COY33_00560 [candidate division WWE3 bacterium CG_4_10_14_0_2_um_filter_42_7]
MVSLKHQETPKITPKIANVISGTAVLANGNILKGAVVNIKDESGKSVRSLMTNELGHFTLSNPLPNGLYTIHIDVSEKESLVKQVELSGKIVPPIDFVTQGKESKYMPLLFTIPKLFKRK